MNFYLKLLFVICAVSLRISVEAEKIFEGNPLVQQKWETKEAYAERLAIDKEICHLEEYAAGKIKEPSSGPLTHRQKALRAAQNAHFHITIAAEIDKKVLASGTQKEVESLMASADKALNEAFQDRTVVKSSIQTLFKGVAKKTDIERLVIEGEGREESGRNEDAFLYDIKRFSFVLFATNNDQRCADYAVDCWDREETVKILCEIYPSSEAILNSHLKGWMDEIYLSKRCAFLFKRGSMASLHSNFINLSRASHKSPEDSMLISETNKARNELLEQIYQNRKDSIYNDFIDIIRTEGQCISDFIQRDIAKHKGMNVIFWGLFWTKHKTETIRREVPFYGIKPDKHVLIHNNHSTKIVCKGALDQMICGKIHENRFKLCQTGEAYCLYRKDYWTPTVEIGPSITVEPKPKALPWPI